MERFEISIKVASVAPRVRVTEVVAVEVALEFMLMEVLVGGVLSHPPPLLPPPPVLAEIRTCVVVCELVAVVLSE